MTHPPCKIGPERARGDWVATRVAVIRVGFAAARYLSTALIRLEAVPLKPWPQKGSGDYRESVTNGKHRRLRNYDVSTLDARSAKKVTAPAFFFPGSIGVIALSVQIYRKKVENG
jgi:hypothetical protein